MKQQTTVDWIKQQIRTKGITHDLSIGEILDQAKEMEKERLTDAYNDGKANGMDISHPLSLTKEILAEKWYDETYGGNR
jgi:hypothetical protein